MNFGFYGRVSTEDAQDPVASRGWQLQRVKALIEPAGGTIVEEFFDIGQSRSLPWKRRPEATRLLNALRDPDRGFSAVAIAEPHRAFSGTQFGEIMPVLDYFGVELWVPEMGGVVDSNSDVQDLQMTIYGVFAKAER